MGEGRGKGRWKGRRGREWNGKERAAEKEVRGRNGERSEGEREGYPPSE